MFTIHRKILPSRTDSEYNCHVVRWILARQDSWGICDICHTQRTLFGERTLCSWGPAIAHIITGECVGTARDIPGHRRVDLRCLRTSCRPLRDHLHIRESVEESRVASTRSSFQDQNIVVDSCSKDFVAKFVLGKNPTLVACLVCRYARRGRQFSRTHCRSTMRWPEMSLTVPTHPR